MEQIFCLKFCKEKKTLDISCIVCLNEIKKFAKFLDGNKDNFDLLWTKEMMKGLIEKEKMMNVWKI